MADRKVSNSKSDLPCRSRSFMCVPFDRPHTISISLLLQLYLYVLYRFPDTISYFPVFK